MQGQGEVGDLDEVRSAAIASYHAAEGAANELRATLVGFVASCEASRGHLETGGVTEGLAGLLPLTTLRTRMTDELARFERARFETRTAVARLAKSEGRPLSDLAKEWGVSRQYVWNLLKADANDISSTPN